MKRQEGNVQLTQEEKDWLARVRAATIVIYLGIGAAVISAPAIEEPAQQQQPVVASSN